MGVAKKAVEAVSKRTNFDVVVRVEDLSFYTLRVAFVGRRHCVCGEALVLLGRKVQ